MAQTDSTAVFVVRSRVNRHSWRQSVRLGPPSEGAKSPPDRMCKSVSRSGSRVAPGKERQHVATPARDRPDHQWLASKPFWPESSRLGLREGVPWAAPAPSAWWVARPPDRCGDIPAEHRLRTSV